jgi:hypothetical protein
MIDPLATAPSYLESGRLDEAETICGPVLKAKRDARSALYLVVRAANARNAHARGLDDRARVETPERAHLYVETAVAHHGLGAYGAAARADGFNKRPNQERKAEVGRISREVQRLI